MTTPDETTPDELLDEILRKHDENRFTFGEISNRKYTAKAIRSHFYTHAEVEQMLPAECKQTRGNSQNTENIAYRTKYAKGYNQAIEDMRQRLSQLRKGNHDTA